MTQGVLEHRLEALIITNITCLNDLTTLPCQDVKWPADFSSANMTGVLQGSEHQTRQL